MSNANLIASVRQRLRNKAEATGEVFDFVISRYAIERLLYRLSVSELNTSFVLKGALLFYVWNGQLHRPTRDLDFLGSGPADADSIKEAFQSIAATSVPEDGLTFFPDTITAEPIREQALYSGIRVGLLVKLGSIKIQVQIDVGFGDAITPGPEESEFPSLLSDFPAPKIRSYPVYTVVAEKLEAMVTLGDSNSRMKDFFDIRFILQTEKLDGSVLSEAIRNTFARRKTPLPRSQPRCLAADFAVTKETQWAAFLRKNGVPSDQTFAEVVHYIALNLPYRWQA